MYCRVLLIAVGLVNMGLGVKVNLEAMQKARSSVVQPKSNVDPSKGSKPFSQSSCPTRRPSQSVQRPQPKLHPQNSNTRTSFRQHPRPSLARKQTNTRTSLANARPRSTTTPTKVEVPKSRSMVEIKEDMRVKIRNLTSEKGVQLNGKTGIPYIKSTRKPTTNCTVMTLRGACQSAG